MFPSRALTGCLLAVLLVRVVAAVIEAVALEFRLDAAAVAALEHLLTAAIGLEGAEGGALFRRQTVLGGGGGQQLAFGDPRGLALEVVEGEAGDARAMRRLGTLGGAL